MLVILLIVHFTTLCCEEQRFVNADSKRINLKKQQRFFKPLGLILFNRYFFGDYSLFSHDSVMINGLAISSEYSVHTVKRVRLFC